MTSLRWPLSSAQRRWGSDIVELAKSSISAWFLHDAASMGASLSFYTLFSIAPVLLVVTGIAGVLLDKNALHQEIVAQIQGLMGDAGATAVNALLAGSAHLGHGVLPSAIGVVSLLIGATSVFAELQRALDRVWDTPVPQGSNGVWESVRTRLLSFGLILGVGFLLLVSLVISAGLAALAAWLDTIMSKWEVLLRRNR